jgi:hypothetical protein
MNIENRLTLLLAENPRAPWASVMHEAAEEIVRLRAKAKEAEALCLSYALRSGRAQGALIAICNRIPRIAPDEYAKDALERIENEFPVNPKEDQSDAPTK